MTMKEIDDKGRQELVPCKIEEGTPEVLWSESYRLSRLNGLSPDSKSFLFKLLHTLLPSKERLNHLTRTTSPLCKCGVGVSETYSHLFFKCVENDVAAQSLLRCVQSYDGGLSEETALRLELKAEEPFILPCIALLAVGLEYIRENRKLNKKTWSYDITPQNYRVSQRTVYTPMF